ncbi:hypothetical protein BCL57_000746 [Agromyces flavus]|uniref:IPT/TIG domain-containing protein n=1 Tax=Agromyces flavus TaxID=589382 RepID=A0ABT1KI99_9MICO|nr:amidase domain-containing protein [Agromyces flavus]MCP2366604.1 hypothetical protein [Agromyces flavus]GGI45008.1 hypothetical protein GCM10010932_07470 [Agromyces flavus]
MPENTKNSFLPAFRRSTYRAPDPASAQAFDLARPDAAPDTADPTARRQALATVPAPAPGHPRHRADRIWNRRPSSGVRRALLLGGASALLGGALVTTIAVTGVDQGPALAAGADREAAIDAAASGAAAASDELVSQVDAARPVVTGGLSAEEAPFTGGTQVTVEGRNLDEVAAVTVAGAPARIVAETPVAITFAVPAVDDAFRGEAEIELTDAAGTPIDVETPAAPSSPAAAAADLIGPVADADAENADAAPTATSEPLTITYTNDPGIDAQLAYVLAHWSSYNSAQYPVLSGVDCANFASQSLVARGWAMDGAWYYDAGTRQMSPAWSSSTALRDYLLTQPGRATALTDAQRDQVKVGDIAQFDWDGSGDRDHTAIVTRVEHTDNGTKVWVGGHTKDADYWDVDQALANGGGSVSYFALG